MPAERRAPDRAVGVPHDQLGGLIELPRAGAGARRR